jgi:hypothetical protein
MVKETAFQDFLVDFVLSTLEHHTTEAIQVEQQQSGQAKRQREEDDKKPSPRAAWETQRASCL